MDAARPKWNSEVRVKARHLLQGLYDEYADQNDEAAAAAMERAMDLFDEEFFMDKRKTSEDDDRIRELFEQGMYASDIARKLNLEYGRVHDRLTRVMGYKLPPKQGRAAPWNGLRAEASAAMDEKFLAMYKTGRTMQEIAAHYNVSRQRVHQRIRRLLGVNSTAAVDRKRQVISVADDTDTWLKLIKKDGVNDD